MAEDYRSLAQLVTGSQCLPGGVPHKDSYNKKALPDRDWWLEHKHHGPWRQRADAEEGGFMHCPGSSLVHKLMDKDHSRRVFQELAKQGNGFAEAVWHDGSRTNVRKDPAFRREVAERYAALMGSPPAGAARSEPSTPHANGARSTPLGRQAQSTPPQPSISARARPSSAPSARRPVPPTAPRPATGGGRPSHAVAPSDGSHAFTAIGATTAQARGNVPEPPRKPRPPGVSVDGPRAKSARGPGRRRVGRGHGNIVTVGTTCWVK